jgi:sensor c-di-GMP phosphodiesterase-like protein
VIVEGVETGEQASYFAEANSSILAQGWLFGRPVPVIEFRSLLAENAKKDAAFADASDRSESAESLQTV